MLASFGRPTLGLADRGQLVGENRREELGRGESRICGETTGLKPAAVAGRCHVVFKGGWSETEVRTGHGPEGKCAPAEAEARTPADGGNRLCSLFRRRGKWNLAGRQHV